MLLKILKIKNLKFSGTSKNFKDQKFDIIKNANVEKIPNLKFITVKDICKHIGGKIV